MRKISCTILLLLFAFTAIAQALHPTETATHIFWQPDRKLTAADFQGDGSSTPRSEELYEKFDMGTMAALGNWSVVDMPQKKLQKKGILEEKIYFVAAFQKNKSYMFDSTDTLGIEFQQLIFDLYELEARVARMALDEYYEAMNRNTGTKATMYMTVKEQVATVRQGFVDSFTRDIYILGNKAEFPKWRQRMDEDLEASKEFATTPEDCYRFYTGQPIVADYEKAKSVIGPLTDRDSIIIMTVDPFEWGRKSR